jgi:hypothetical protein
VKPGVAVRLGVPALALLLGALTGAAVAVLHAGWVWLVLGFVAAVLLIAWFRTRGSRTALALAWGVVVLRAAAPRPEGDFLIAANTQGWTLLLGSFVLLLVALVLPDRPTHRTRLVSDQHPRHT